MPSRLVAYLLSWLVLAVVLGGCRCGTGAGDTSVCEDPPPCEIRHAAAVLMFSKKSCESAVSSSWCGVNAQKLAECLRDAKICLEMGTSRDAIAAALEASACAEQFKAWDGCFANGEADDIDFDD
jgi:hypothetical protein